MTGSRHITPLSSIDASCSFSAWFVMFALYPATCTFSGGSDGAGNVDVTSNTGNKKIQVRLTDQGYGIADVTFSGEGQDQMSFSGGGQSHVVNIFNRNTGPANVKYSVIVENQATGETRDCDPRIINR